MQYSEAILVFLALLVVVAFVLLGPLYLGAEKASTPAKEGYGPPPGMRRALSPYEIPTSRGWVEFGSAYEGSSAASVSHMIERSA